ncbi:MAG TPA: hypothetical protein VHK69_02135 [Chitinophagaceae bacterium]|nr:hypothetical protein [Chitinophagaceae bacterium]
MKQILLLLLLVPLFGRAQDCSLKKDKDAFSQEPKLTTGFINLNGKRVSLDATAKEIDFLFHLGSDNCFDDASTAVVTFEGGRLKSTFRNTGTMNCDGYFHINFRNGATTPGLLQRMATKKIVSIRFTGNAKNETVITLSEELQQQVMSQIACIVNEGKTLLKP